MRVVVADGSVSSAGLSFRHASEPATRWLDDGVRRCPAQGVAFWYAPDGAGPGTEGRRRGRTPAGRVPRPRTADS
jgi:hypothetical protein